MKTKNEIQREAQRLVAQGELLRRLRPGAATSSHQIPRTIFYLPVTPLATYRAINPSHDSGMIHCRERQVEVVIEKGEPAYQLRQWESVRTDSGQTMREEMSAVVMAGSSAYDVLFTGYRLVEEERLGGLLKPYLAQRRRASVSNEAVAEVEVILETNLLRQGERMRARREICEFFEGAVEIDDFIASAIQRQSTRDEWLETQVVSHELRLAIDEL